MYIYIKEKKERHLSANCNKLKSYKCDFNYRKYCNSTPRLVPSMVYAVGKDRCPLHFVEITR